MKNALIFVLGAAVGSVAAWYFTKTKYEQLIQEEIDSVKESYARLHTDELKESIEAEDDQWDRVEAAAKASELGYISDQDSVVTPREEEVEEEMGHYYEISVIAPEEFGEEEEYGTETLAYYADGILADLYGNIIETPEEYVGDALNRIGEYEEDAVHVRNDELNMYYEILRDNDKYTDR